ncbi:MAG: tetratricopeptide repeat protein [Planctomyces sp.]|nr:tetratricopeptide repeat protein [Planctomyces sp.]
MSDQTMQPSAPKKVVHKAVGPKLRIVFNIMLALLALIGANSVYLGGISFLEWWTGEVYQDYFYLCMVLAHIVVGFIIVTPFLVFGVVHIRNTKDRKIRRTVWIGYALFGVCIMILVSGFLLMFMRNEGVLNLRNPVVQSMVYWGHVAGPVVGLWLYWLHRLVGPKMRWKSGLAWAGVSGATAAVMVYLQAQDPREWNAVGPASGAQYFEPSLARTATGNFIPAETLDMNHYCIKCHKDAHDQWAGSAHRFSSFNNPAYLATVAETREVGMKRDGTVQGSRFCAGCHDPVPFFSGAFDDPKFDMLNHPTAQAGITCTTCHAITHVNSTRGNADFTIEEPLHYPFAYSENAVLQWVNNQLVKAKPAFHKKTFLKPLHKTAEFCGSCHKVHLPYTLNHYKDFLRGQNHYDPWLLSGVSGHGARSFYYPEKAQTNCNECHMPIGESDDLGAKLFDESGQLKTHDHLFPSANTAVAWFHDKPEVIEAHRKFLQGIMRVDVFGVREGGEIDSPLSAPLRPEVPSLKKGQKYLLETVIRTLKMGHHFTQGTTDSNEVWLEVTMTSGDRQIGASGLMDEDKGVDPWAHFVNNFMIDREGNRIDRRNAQDIFIPLYNNQIPPGAGQTVHYSFRVPEDVDAPVTVKVRLLYRKFDKIYMEFVDKRLTSMGTTVRGHKDGEPYRNELPIVVMAEDSVTFPVEGVEAVVDNPKREIPEWQRWNDYGIGLLLKGKAELKQAADAFREVEKLGRYDGPLNLARVLLEEAGEGQLAEAVDAIKRAAAHKEPAAPPWTLAWISGVANRQQGFLKEAAENFRQVLEYKSEDTIKRKFDFSKDYEVINLLGQTLFDLGSNVRRAEAEPGKTERRELFEEAVEVYHRTLELDSENIDAHYNLALLYRNLASLAEDGTQEKSSEELNKLADQHQDLHARYKIDDTARGQAIGKAREKYPAANAKAERVVIYDLQRVEPTESAELTPQKNPGDAE